MTDASLGTSKGPANYNFYSRSTNLARLNPQCYMNYLVIFTEISFSPKTSKWGDGQLSKSDAGSGFVTMGIHWNLTCY